MLFYLTWWGNHLTIISLLLCVVAGTEKRRTDLRLKRLTAIFFQIALVVEAIVVVVYWAVLARSDLALDPKEYGSGWYLTYVWAHKVAIHTAPALAVAFNTVLTRGIVIPAHSAYMLVLGCVYLPVNYVGTMYYGKPLYHFLTWTSYKTILIGLFIFFIAGVIHQVFCLVTIKYKSRAGEMYQELLEPQVKGK
jgi:ABC-type dipeptide/oligopeptide/nickel transport system permease subunit